MRGTVRKTYLIALAVLALSLLGIGLLFWGGKATVVKAAASDAKTPAHAFAIAAAAAPAPGAPAVGEPAPAAQKPDNSQCLSCHSAPNQVHKFPNGDTVSISVDPQVFDNSVHNTLACQACHTNINSFPHPANSAGSAREYTLQYKNTCKQCHPNQVAETEDSAHAKLAKEGNPNAPTCADCHKAHSTAPIALDANGDPAPSERTNIAGICSKCHSAIVDQYKNSVHGAALIKDANPDVPACNDCHGVHKITQARTVEFRLNSPNLCATCHTRHDIMDKYGISTDVLNTYVADFHGTTVTLFERTDPTMATNKPVCYDCHGVHNIVAVDDPQRGLEIKQNMLVACQRCHPDASENFPASWMSHYIASPTKFPLVYYVNLFYKFFIPGVLGFMAVFVLSDILHKIGITGRRNPPTKSTGQAKE